MSGAVSTVSPSAKKEAMHEHPIGALFLGAILLFFALWGVAVQLTTSESWYIHGSSIAISIAPNFGILLQPGSFFQGSLKGIEAQAFTYAWGMEVVQFLFSTGLFFSMLKHNRVASWICIVLSIAIMVLDSIADYQANGGANGWQQIGFTLIVFMMAFGLLYSALYLIIVKGIIGLVRH